MIEILSQNALITLTLISVAISFVISALYHISLDKEEMEKLKKESEDFKKKMEKAKKEGNEKEMNKYMKEMMNASQKQMKMNFKPMIYTFIVIIPLFLLVFPSTSPLPIKPLGIYGDAFVKLEKNTLSGEFNYHSLSTPVSVTKNDQSFTVRIGDIKETKGKIFELGDYKFEVAELTEKENGYRLKLSRVIAELPVSLPLVGKTLGWLAWYILLSFPFTQLFRKLFGVA